MHTICATTTLQSQFLRTTIIAVLAAGAMMATAPTAAACGQYGQTQPGVLRQAPMFPAVAGQAEVDDSHRGMVGLWYVQYTDSHGNPFYVAFDMWHADGTEWETSFGDPRQGNYCLGVWKQVGPRTVKLSHVAWVYNSDGSPAGYFTLAETDTINRKGDSYTGTFDYKQYDPNGNFQYEITGSQAATRFHL